MTTSINERKRFFIENITLTLYSRKGCERVDVGYVWKVSWRRGQTATYWPQVPLYYSSTSSSFCWAAQPGSWGSKPSVRRWLSLRHLVPNYDWNSNCDCNLNWTLPASDSNWLKPSVAPGYIIVWHPPTSCGRRICTEFNPSTGQDDIPISSTGYTCFLIDGSVEGQYVTTD